LSRVVPAPAGGFSAGARIAAAGFIRRLDVAISVKRLQQTYSAPSVQQLAAVRMQFNWPIIGRGPQRRCADRDA
jgi:hypothetical protein